MDALNLKLLDPDKFIKEHGCLEVTSPFIHQPTSTGFDQNGLFSETIFGEVASDWRLIKFGWMKLNCHVFHPVIFQNLQTLKRFYIEIMSGKSFAKWDNESKDLVRAGEDEDGADTGFSFFLKYFPKIDFKKNKSLRRNDRIDVLLKYKNIALIDKMIIMPAGIRDMKEEEGRLEKDSVNNLYLSLMTSARAMPPSGDTDPIYDVIHYSVQRKVMEIYEYISGLVEGKGGFLQGKLGHRSIVGATRNVISATDMDDADPSDPQFHKVDEVKVPLYQAAKGYASLVIYQMKSLFYSSIVNQNSDNIALIDPDDFKLKYLPIDPKDKDMLITEEGIQKMIDRFRDPEYRFRPVTARSNGKPYYLYLVYDNDKEIYIIRQLTEFITDFGDKYDQSKLRPLTYAEMIYIATFFASNGKSGTITRYPVTDAGSIFAAKTHLVTTSPARVVKFVSNVSTGEGITLPEYPILKNKVIDVLKLHSSRLAGLGADFDGDTVSWIPLYSDEANEECNAYYNSASFYANPDGGSQLGVDDLTKITMHAMTADCKDLK